MCPPSAFTQSSTSASAPTPDPSTFIPSTEISKSVYAHAASLLSTEILNHSIRVYLYAKTVAEKTNSTYAKGDKHDLLLTACLLHDIGTTTQYNGTQRFEVEGADAAVKHLLDFGVPKEEAHEVWMAIALHTSTGIAERINELTAIVREAVVFDFHRAQRHGEELAKSRERVEAQFPRGELEKILGDLVVEQAVQKPEKAPHASWPGVLFRAHLAEPEWRGVNKAF